MEGLDPSPGEPHPGVSPGPTSSTKSHFTQNQIWCAIVALACELLAWLAMLAFSGNDARRDARRWEHKRLRLRLLSIPARLVRTARATRLRLAVTPWTGLAHTAWRRLVPG